MLDKLKQLNQQAQTDILNCEGSDKLRDLEIKYLGRKSELVELMKGLKDLPASEKPQAGKLANEVKVFIVRALQEKKQNMQNQRALDGQEVGFIDVTLPGISHDNKEPEPGHLHPITQIQYEVEEIFTSMGFMVLDGPETESEYYNFDALNIPAHHPARDTQDTFWLEDGNLLRTQTSAVQVRGLLKHGVPIRAIVPGRCFRNEATDASHENTFYQIEGLMVDKNITVANLIAVMKEMLTQIFKKEVQVRLRPGFFPFVEPGFELDINCLICGGQGCSVCKQTGWVELVPCGMVHPNVLKFGKVDPDKYNGFAFGLGLDRLVMMRYGVDDIRLFHGGDLRFIKQF